MCSMPDPFHVAQNTLRALQREREVAERIEQGIKALRARSGAGKVTAGR